MMDMKVPEEVKTTLQISGAVFISWRVGQLFF